MESDSANGETAGIEEAIRDSDILEQLGIRLDDDVGGPDRVTIECYPLDEFQLNHGYDSAQSKHEVSSTRVLAKLDPLPTPKQNMDMDFDWLFAGTSSSNHLGSVTSTNPNPESQNGVVNRAEKICTSERSGMSSPHVSCSSESDMPKNIQKLKAELKSRDITILNMKKLLLEEKELRLVRRKQIENHRELSQCKKNYEELLPAYQTLETEVFRLRTEVDSNRSLIEQQEACINSLKADNNDLKKNLETGTAPEKKKLQNEIKDLKRKIRKYEEEIDSKNATIAKLRTKASSNSAMSDIINRTSGSGNSPSMAHIMENVRHLISKEFKKLNGNLKNPVLSSLSENSDTHRESDTDDTESFHLPSRLSTISSLDGDSFDGNYTESTVPSVASMSPPSSVDNRDYVEPNDGVSNSLLLTSTSTLLSPVFIGVMSAKPSATSNNTSSASSVCSISSGYSSPQKSTTSGRRKRNTSFQTSAVVPEVIDDKKSFGRDSKDAISKSPKVALPLAKPLPSISANLFTEKMCRVSKGSPKAPVKLPTVLISPVRRSPRRKTPKAYDSSDWETPETVSKMKNSVDASKGRFKSPKVGKKCQDILTRSIFDSDGDNSLDSFSGAESSQAAQNKTNETSSSSRSNPIDDPMTLFCATEGMSTPVRVSGLSEDLDLSSCSELSLCFSPSQGFSSPDRGPQNEIPDKSESAVEKLVSQGVSPCVSHQQVIPIIQASTQSSVLQTSSEKHIASHIGAKKSPSSKKRNCMTLSDSDSEDEPSLPLVTSCKSSDLGTSFRKNSKTAPVKVFTKEKYDICAASRKKEGMIQERTKPLKAPKELPLRISARDKIGNTTDIVAVGSGENMCSKKKLEVLMRQRGKPKYLELLKSSAPGKVSSKLIEQEIHHEVVKAKHFQGNGPKSSSMDAMQPAGISTAEDMSVPAVSENASGPFHSQPTASTSESPASILTCDLNFQPSVVSILNAEYERNSTIKLVEKGHNEDAGSTSVAISLAAPVNSEVTRKVTVLPVSLADDLCLSSDEEDSNDETELIDSAEMDQPQQVSVSSCEPVETAASITENEAAMSACTIEQVITLTSGPNSNILPKLSSTRKPPLRPITRRICNTQSNSSNCIPARTKTAPSVFRTKVATLNDTVVSIDTVQEGIASTVENVQEYCAPAKRIRLARASDAHVPIIRDGAPTTATASNTNIKIGVPPEVTKVSVSPLTKGRPRNTISTLNPTLSEVFQPKTSKPEILITKKLEETSQKLSARHRLRDSLAIVAVGSGENVCDKLKLELLTRKTVARRRLDKEKSSTVLNGIITGTSSTEKGEIPEEKTVANTSTAINEGSGYSARGRVSLVKAGVGASKSNAVVGLLRGSTSKPTTQQKLLAQLRKMSSARSTPTVKSKCPKIASHKIISKENTVARTVDEEALEIPDVHDSASEPACGSKTSRHRTAPKTGSKDEKPDFGIPLRGGIETQLGTSVALATSVENTTIMEVTLKTASRNHRNGVDAPCKNTIAAARPMERCDDSIGADMLKKLFGVIAKSVTPEQFAFQFKNVEAELKKPPLSFYLSRRFYDDVVDSVLGYAMQKTDEKTMTDRAKNLCAKIKWLQSVHHLYRKLDISIVSYFISEILAKRSYVFPRDDILNGVGIVYGTVFREFDFPKLAADALFIVLLNRTQQKFAFAQGFLSAFPDLFANKRALQSILPRGIFMALVYAPLYTDSIYYNNLRDIFRDGLDIATPELDYKAVFRNMWDSFKVKEMEDEIDEGEKTFSMLLVQCHWNLSAQIVEENFDIIYSEWRNNQISDAVFVVFLKSIVWAAAIVTATESNLSVIQNKFEKLLAVNSSAMTPPLHETLTAGIKQIQELVIRNTLKMPSEPTRYVTHNSLRQLKANEAKEDKKMRRKFKRRIRGAAARKRKGGQGSQNVPEVTRAL